MQSLKNMSAYGQKSDHGLVRDYITAADHLQYSLLPEDLVCVSMTHSNLPQEHPDLRLNLHMTISEVKEKFRLHIGTPVDHQRLILKDNGRIICQLSDDNKMLGYYSVISGMEIHIIDLDPYSLSRNGGLTDVSLVQKYKMSDEDYSSRKGTMRSYIQEQRLKDPKFKLKPKGNVPTFSKASDEPVPDALTVEGITIGSRCEVMPGARRGIVRFVGEIPTSVSGYWVGVQLDEPVGKGDGSAKGSKIFECEQNFGGFFRGKNVKVGDFPERDLLDESDGEDANDNGAQSEEDEI